MTIDLKQVPRPRFCYIEMPATDPHKSAEFYEKVFGWNIRRRESDQPSFDDASGYVSGMFVTYLKAAAAPGLLPSIWVDDINAMVDKVKANGGEIIENPRPDAPGSTCLIATFRDPGGNTLRLYAES
jgi:predicted enzyme related to lactoylglutathione lyase